MEGTKGEKVRKEREKACNSNRSLALHRTVQTSSSGVGFYYTSNNLGYIQYIAQPDKRVFLHGNT